jgi:hypothetical protein
VEVIKIVNLIRIQIGLEFRKDLKIKKPFSNFLLAMGRIPPSRPNLASHISPAHGPASPSSSPARSPTTLPGFPRPVIDPTRHHTRYRPKHGFVPGLIHPLHDFSMIFMT